MVIPGYKRWPGGMLAAARRIRVLQTLPGLLVNEPASVRALQCQLRNDSPVVKAWPWARYHYNRLYP